MLSGSVIEPTSSKLGSARKLSVAWVELYFCTAMATRSWPPYNSKAVARHRCAFEHHRRLSHSSGNLPDLATDEKLTAAIGESAPINSLVIVFCIIYPLDLCRPVCVGRQRFDVLGFLTL